MTVDGSNIEFVKDFQYQGLTIEANRRIDIEVDKHPANISHHAQMKDQVGGGKIL